MTTPDASPLLNAFGIPVPEGEPASAPRYLRQYPLIPWHVSGHEHLYAPVDNIEECFTAFTRQMSDATGLEDFIDMHGSPITLVSGPPRSGRSSLLNLCADHLGKILSADSPDEREAQPAPWALKPRPSNVDFVPLSKVNQESRLIYTLEDLPEHRRKEEIGRHIHDRITSHLKEKHPWFENAVNGSSETRSRLESTDIDVRYEELVEQLNYREYHIMVIVPNIERRSNGVFEKLLLSCLQYGSGRIFFFIESTEANIRDIGRAGLTQRETDRLIRLKIGKLNPDDCAKFIERRLSPELWQGPYIQVADDAFKGHRPELDYFCVSDLQRIFYGVARETIRDGSDLIDLARLSAYQERTRPYQGGTTR